MKYFIQIILFLILISKSYGAIWNSPYSDIKDKRDTLYSSFSLPPKHLDPVVSYSSNEWAIISQIYEPPLQYNYIKRPYQLESLTLKNMPNVIYNPNSDTYTYILRFRKDIKYQPHPAFIKKYRVLNSKELENIFTINDFKKTSTRTLKAQDYEYAIKRMAVRQ
ncbi:MAG: peptide ABC transporter substrate-binding protein, partial [Sulfurovaceae bacterium]|nr:peptide ABC transporter substrate-binding protein [Sulfurovaceae bacterium]